MKKAKRILLVLLSLIISITLYSRIHQWYRSPLSWHMDGYVYWSGYTSYEALQEKGIPWIYAWDLSTNKQICTGSNGYILQGGREDTGAFAVAWSALESSHITILRLQDGMAQINCIIPRPKDCLWLIAYYPDWTYYTFYESEQSYGIRRINQENHIDTYDLSAYVPVDRVNIRHDDYFNEVTPKQLYGRSPDLVASVSPNGTIAVCRDEYGHDIVLLDAHGNVEEFETMGGCFGWLSSEKLLFTDYFAYCYDVATKEMQKILTKNGNGIRIESNISGIYPNDSGKLLVYQEYDPRFEGDSYYPMYILDMSTGKSVQSSRISTRKVFSPDYTTAFQFGS